MKLDRVFKKPIFQIGKKGHVPPEKSLVPEVPEGLLKKCPKCGKAILAEDVKKQQYICPKCRGYFRTSAKRRLEIALDKGSFEEWKEELPPSDPLEYPGYEEKKQELQKRTGLTEAVVTGKGWICGQPAAVGVLDGRFLMASMGYAVGERITRMVERATKEGLPVVLFTCSGGARLQEGIVSLMQMAKTAAAFKRHKESGSLYISVLTDPTMGGVTASFAMLGDVILAEPGARIGFAGPRVIEQTIGGKLPEGFQKSEFLLEKGFLDGIVKREEMRKTLGFLLELHNRAGRQKKQEDAEDFQPGRSREEQGRQERQPGQYEEAAGKKKESAWARVKLSRKKDRPVARDYIDALFPDFFELHGDRESGEDKAILGGIASFLGRPVTVVAQAKGRTTKENVERNFGMPMPEGYRKVRRLAKEAQRWGRPIVCLVDTPGAFCGTSAEERGQGEAIARNLAEFSDLTVPVVAIVIGEGGSGGALGMAVADEVWMLENAVYSILSPEGFASILWKDGSRAKEAAEMMKLTAKDLYAMGVVEKIIREPESYTAKNMEPVTAVLIRELHDFFHRQEGLSGAELRNRRYERFRKM